MECYKLIEGRLTLVPDPTVEFEGQDFGFGEMLKRAGYTVRVCNTELESDCAAISIYETELTDRPRYYLDVMGDRQGIAALVADDFPALLATLREVEPLTSLIALAQRARLLA